MPLMVESALAEGNKIGGIKIPGVQNNSYSVSSSATAQAIKSQAATSGHNVFRPDIYRVSEGYVT